MHGIPRASPRNGSGNAIDVTVNAAGEYTDDNSQMRKTIAKRLSESKFTARIFISPGNDMRKMRCCA